jgi:hypothetical protein
MQISSQSPTAFAKVVRRIAILLLMGFLPATADLDPGLQSWSFALTPQMNVLIERSTSSTLVIYHKGSPIIRLEAHAFYPAVKDVSIANPWASPTQIRDLNSDGIPDWAVISWSGGAHCCRTLHIISLGEEPILVDSLKLEHSPFLGFEDMDGDGQVELTVDDWTFAYWNAPFALSPAPKIILSLRADGFHLRPDLMHRPPPTEEKLQEWIKEIHDHPDWDRENGTPPPLLWGRMLDLIFQGQSEVAELLYEDAWLDDFPGKETFRIEFFEALFSSEWILALGAVQIN